MNDNDYYTNRRRMIIENGNKRHKLLLRSRFAFGAFFLFCLVLSLAGVGTIVYVAYHFISKFW